jgi:hypothetical protein
LSLESDLFDALKGLVGNRVYPDIAPQAVARPYIVYQQVGGRGVNFVDPTVPSKKNARIQVAAWADTRAAASALGRQIEDTLRGGRQITKSDSYLTPANKLRRWTARFYLSGNVASAVKQLASVPVWANVVGFRDFTRYLTHIDPAAIAELVTGIRAGGVTSWLSNQNGTDFTNIQQRYEPRTQTITTTSTYVRAGRNISITQHDFSPKGVNTPNNASQGMTIKRMILRNVVSSYGLSGTDQGHINDLRCIIAKFMGRDEPHWNATASVVAAARRQTGEWFDVDGGALRIRVYMKGTGHLEVHPDMAWRLNAVLASIYPAAIPSSFREPPKRKAKDVQPIQKPLPFAVIGLLANMKDGYRIEKNTGGDWRREYNHVPVRNSLKFDHGTPDKQGWQHPNRSLSQQSDG